MTLETLDTLLLHSQEEDLRHIHLLRVSPVQCALRDGIIEYEELRKQALIFRPAMIFCGASAYPRTIDFARFRAIADEVDAILIGGHRSHLGPSLRRSRCLYQRLLLLICLRRQETERRGFITDDCVFP